MKANRLLKENISALLRQRGYTQRDLAQWCYRSEGWLSAILTQEKRRIPVSYYDRIADFFGLATYQLLQPGIAGAAERRRTVPRRSGKERRISARAAELNSRAGSEVGSPTSSRVGRTPTLSAVEAQRDLEAVRQELTRLSQQLARIASGADDRTAHPDVPRQVSTARHHKPKGRSVAP